MSFGPISEVPISSLPEGGQSIAVGLITETGTPLALGVAKKKTLGLITETGSPLAIASRVKKKTLGLLTATEEVFHLTLAGELGLIVEVGSAMAIETVTKSRELGMVTEVGTLLPLTPLKKRTLGLITETGTALGITVERGESRICPTPQIVGQTFKIEIVATC